MFQEMILRRELAWVAKRVALIFGVLIAIIACLAGLHLSEPVAIPFAIAAFALAHVWLLAWLTFRLKLMYHHGELVSLQIRWRESNKLFVHIPVRLSC